MAIYEDITFLCECIMPSTQFLAKSATMLLFPVAISSVDKVKTGNS